MANPHVDPTAEGNAHARVFGKTRIILLGTLLGLLVLCIVFSWTTRGVMAHLPSFNGKGRTSGASQSLVDLRPWQTASALAPLAVSSEENEYAREAERLADHEVDQAFAAALRLASLAAQHRTLTGEALVLSRKIAQLQQLKQQDQALVNSLTAKAAANGAAKDDSDNNDLDVAKAQLGLDTDELSDAQDDLQRASGDNSGEIQDELTAHEASMRKYDSQTSAGEQPAVVSTTRHRTLAGRIAAWFSQNDRQASIEQALAEAQDTVRSLTIEHNALEARANAANAQGAAQDRTAQLASLKDRSTERQVLSIYDDRIQTEQQLANVYAKWLAQVKVQHQILLHLILRSFMVILLILIAMFLCDALIHRIMARPAGDRRQMRTLRGILTLSVQVLGIVLILLVIFGMPQQTPTILGLATAALTIALQDYILAFIGWFVLMRKRGIHVGDWVEINGVNGEVAEVGLLSTTLLEIGGPADQGHPTGRHISFMNSFAIRGQYFNFSTAGQWMWDEIAVNVPASADIHTIMERIQKAVEDETAENARRAEQEWKRGSQREVLNRFSVAPVVSLRPTGSGVELHVRFVTAASARFDLRNRLFQHVVELLHEQSTAAQ
ncbi:MAG TPA: mechanosensitive ion channel family protein [Terracidiphilus sp.]|nr:mechanosensitive ion channel family protein [Terracidiphilus sp.]